MTTALIIFAIAALCFYFHHRGYKQGHSHGYGKGYDYGHREADNWWVRAEEGAQGAREEIWREEAER